MLFAVFLFLVLWRGGLVGLDLLVFGAMVVGSVLPDLDHPRGLIYHFLRFPGWVRRGVCAQLLSLVFSMRQIDFKYECVRGFCGG